MSNCELHSRIDLFDTRDAALRALSWTWNGITSADDTATDVSIYAHRRLVAQPIAGEGRGVMKILMAVDDSGFAEDLLRAVVVGIRHENTEVLVLHVLQPVDTVPPPEMAQGYAPELEEEKQPARLLVERIAAELRKAGFTAQTGVQIGDVANTILAQSVEWDADLIAVGSHGQRSIHDFLLGSVAESVARRAQCSVVIVRKTGKK
jgi:universal stress protein A